jgi:hypothetical protein
MAAAGVNAVSSLPTLICRETESPLVPEHHKIAGAELRVHLYNPQRQMS